MAELRCQDCGSVIAGTNKDIDESECECGGSYAIKGSEDDEYEPNVCSNCKKEIPEDDDTWTCCECEEENICEDCMLPTDNVDICKECVDELYPRQAGETKTEYVDKIVEKIVYLDKEGTPINTSFNPTNKTRFD